MSFWTVHLNPAPSNFDAFHHPVGPSTYTLTRANNEQCEQFTLCEHSEQRTVRTTNSANNSHCANSANNEQCEQFTLCEQCEQRTVRTVHIVRTERTTNSANSSHCPNSPNSEQCEQFTLYEQCEQRTVRTVHIVRTVRTANSANSSFFKNRRTGRTVRTGANTVRWSLIYSAIPREGRFALNQEI